MSRFRGPDRLASGHDLDGFARGIRSLDQWLARHARGADGSGSARTYVITDGEQETRVVGYHSLTLATVELEEATDDVRRGMPGYPIPAVLLARLAVDRSVQGMGLGAALLADALKRTVSVSEEAGTRLLLVHAVDQGAANFYTRFGFEVSPTDPMNLQLPVSTIRKSLDRSVSQGNE